MTCRSLVVAAACAVASAVAPAGAIAAGPPVPVSTAGHDVTLVATGLQTPTSFAFGAETVFAGDAGNPGVSPGGVYVLRDGTSTRLDGSPPEVSGLAWHEGRLYVAAGTQLLAWSGWNGTEFGNRQVIYTGPAGFTGFNGIGFGANGRLYAGVFLPLAKDHGPSDTPFAFDVLSFDAAGGDLRIVATGMRQPFGFAFPQGSSNPFVSDDGQDFPDSVHAPDLIVRVHQGANFGYPNCNWSAGSPCDGFTQPVDFLPAHSSPSGIGIIGHSLYAALFTGIGASGPGVVSVPLSGGTVTPILTGFVAPVVGLSTHGGSVYVGDLTGSVYSVKP
jgi:glucose/arabinose dehydrogenase